MSDGSWFPVDNSLIAFLPKDRAYTVLEAYLSLSCDLFHGRNLSSFAYAKIWGWNRKAVVRFMEDVQNGGYHGSIRYDKCDAVIRLKGQSRVSQGSVEVEESQDVTGRKGQSRVSQGSVKKKSERKKKELPSEESLFGEAASVEPKVEAGKKIELPPNVPHALMVRFYRHREEIGKPMTALAVKQMADKFSKLVEEGYDLEAIVSDTINSGKWMDVYPKESHRKKVAGEDKFRAGKGSAQREMIL